MKKQLFLLIIFIFSYLFIFNKESVLAICNPKCNDPYVCRNGVCKIPPQPTSPPPQPTTPPVATATPAPTTGPGTPTPTQPAAAWSIAPVVAGTEELCQLLTVSDTLLSSGETMTITSKSTNSDIVSFGWWFYNRDNLNTANDPKPIKFVTGSNVAGVIKNVTIADNEYSLTVKFDDLNRTDLNWTNYMPKPKRIKVDAYFKKVGSTTWSKYNAACSKNFNVATVDPTPTPNPACVCAANACATACSFDKYPTGVTYTNPIKCSVIDGYSSTPTDANKTQWCRNYYRTKGDANGDGSANILDYFYYIAVSFGAKIHPSINLDFNGDGVVSSADKAILIKTLKQ